MVDKILQKEELTKEDIVTLLKIDNFFDMEKLYEKAYSVKEKYIGKKNYYRGLIEFSNYCVKNCYYCGIRKDASAKRYNMTKQEILKMAEWAHVNEYGSVTIQSGERQDEEFTEFITDIIKEIKKLSNNTLGITLSLGEQTLDTYKKWFEAGAHRYLLRIETSNKKLYQELHPNDDLHSFEKRIDCLKLLKKAGYQVGTGIMIGFPNQTPEDIAEDIIFFKNMDIDMLGMGPYVIEKSTPTGQYVLENNLNTKEEVSKRFNMSMKVVALCRIYLKDVNIAASTAMQALHPLGREKALRAGANILMPIITLEEYRADYQLYDNKPCVEDNSDKCKICLTNRVGTVGETVGFGEWGDSPHFKRRHEKAKENR